MKEQLITILESFGYPVFLQGSLAKDEPYPQSFFTFWNADTSDSSHYDDQTIGYIWEFDINFYSTDPETVNTVLNQAVEELKKSKWIIGGTGQDLPTDEPTHTGRGVTALFIDYFNNRAGGYYG